MATARAQAFQRAIRAVACPPLRTRGFAFDGRANFRRRVEHPGRWAVHIVNFQMGQRSLEGRFAVNLALYHPELSGDLPVTDRPTEAHCRFEMRQRLGYFIDPPEDRWWPLCEDDGAMKRVIMTLIPVLLDKGLHWLEQADSEERIAKVRSVIEERRHRLRQRMGIDGDPSDRP